MMEFMEQIELWNQNGAHERIVEAIEALAEAERSPQLVSVLARAYNNLAEAGDSALLQKAIDLLYSVEEALQDDPAWNFRLGYAYYYLDQEGPALRYFERALELRPEDAQAQQLADDCRGRLALPWFEKPFRVRAAEGWDSFLAGEVELRSMIENKQYGERLTERCCELLSPAFDDIAFQLGFDGEKCELALTPEGNLAKLFQLVYFQRHAPAAVLAHWNILIGRQASERFSLRMFDWDVAAEDVQVWMRTLENGRLGLSLYCEKLLPLLRENEADAAWFLSVLLDQSIGELSVMDLVDDFTVLEAPEDGTPVALQRLAQALRERGFALTSEAEQILERYTAYEMEPEEGEELRLDVFAGVTRCPAFINAYLQGQSGLMDDFHRDGAVPGFFYYPLDAFGAEERGKRILEFRDHLESAVLQRAGEDALVFIGGASGVRHGYLDLIAWDLPAVLEAAEEVFRQAPVDWAAFHTFRRDVGGVWLKEAEAAGEAAPQENA